MRLLNTLSQTLAKYFNLTSTGHRADANTLEDRHTTAERLVHISNELDSAYEFIPPPPTRPFGRE